MADINAMLGEILNMPVFWVAIVVIAIFVILWYAGVFKRKNPEFKGEPLKETLLRDIRPRLKKQGKKAKGTHLVQHYHKFGKVRKWCEGDVKFYKQGGKKGKGAKGTKDDELVEHSLKVLYFEVGGNPWLSWIPIIGKWFDPDYYVLNQDHVERLPQSGKWIVNDGIHVFPYGEIWVGDAMTQRYLTELEARRTMEHEAEAHINSLKRWIFYEDHRAGHVVFKEREAQLEREKWDKIREEAE